jgi:hypothetical protein
MVKTVSERVKVNLKGISSLIKALTHSNNKGVKVGILSEKNAREGSIAETNAGIGIVHEFGSYKRNIPERSFIKMPLESKAKELVKFLQKELDDKLKGDKDKKGPVKEVEEDMIDEVLERLGAQAVGYIMDAFKSGGFGNWPALKPATIKAKKTDAILVDTGFLEGSIMFKVAKR